MRPSPDGHGKGETVREPIAPERIVEGAPQTELINQYEAGEHTYAGEWAATLGAWRVAYDEWEFCHILEGRCQLTPDGGQPQTYGPGDSFVIEPGFKGVWRVMTATMRKRYVIRL